jgi:hypothetical protein
VTAAYGGHIDYLPFDQLEPVVLVEYPRLGHAVVLMDGEAPPGNLRLRLRLQKALRCARALRKSIPEL